jgi:hypothetical protein
VLAVEGAHAGLPLHHELGAHPVRPRELERERRLHVADLHRAGEAQALHRPQSRRAAARLEVAPDDVVNGLAGRDARPAPQHERCRGRRARAANTQGEGHRLFTIAAARGTGARVSP